MKTYIGINMAVNNDTNNKLYAVNDTSVKFFSSLSRKLAKGEETFVYDGHEVNINSFPGAICYVSDSQGNSIYLNKLLFGDGANAGGLQPGINPGTGGITEVNLGMIPVVEKDGVVLKSLADYFSNDGTFITNSLNIVGTYLEDGTDKEKTIRVSANKEGLAISGDIVATLTWVYGEVNKSLQESKNYSDLNLQSAKNYADGLLTSVYVVKGSVPNFNSLPTNAKAGWVYNVESAYNNIPAGTNYVYVVPDDASRSPYWDALGGTVDLSAYVTKNEFDNYDNVITNKILNLITEQLYTVNQNIDSIRTNITSIESSIGLLDSNIKALLDLLLINSTNIASNKLNIEQNIQNITNISTLLTWQ